MRVADRGGLVKVSMRNVGSELGVEALSLYHHVAGKDALLDGLANWVVSQIELPDAEALGRPAMVARAASARTVLSQHPSGLGLIESRRVPGEALLRHHEAIVACLRHNGFSPALATHAFSAIDAYVYGFVLTELNLPFGADESAESFAHEIQQLLPVDRYPSLVESLTELVMGKDFAYADEFAFGLDLLLDSLERHLASKT